jgi:hypothetical protein
VRILLAAAVAAVPLLADPGIDYFEAKVRPLLAAKCYACHSARLSSPMGGLRFDDPATVRSAAARLLPAIRYQSVGMPPTGKLPADEVAIFEKWVEMGTPVPAGTADSNRPAAKATNHWAWQPLRPGTGGIDSLIAAKLKENGLSASPRADQRTLIRRLSFDLTGLPPAAADFDLPTEKAVDKYLASPRFGERWARHWMDVARYADTGFLSRPFLASFPYRDWLIDAFNRDVPYDRFIALQLAADQLPNTPRKDFAALGFLSLGQNPNRAVDLPDVVDDKIDLVSRGLLGLTVACARCHDHKFDPIPTKDYYGLYGVFANTRYGVEPVHVAPLPAFYEKRSAERKRILDAYITERLEVLRAEFREPKEVRRYLEALWEGRNLSPARLENLAREKNLLSLVLTRWAARVASDPFFAAWRQATVSPVNAYLERLAGPEGQALLRGPGAPPQVPVEDFPAIMTEGDANTTRDLQWQYEQMLNDALYRGSKSIVLGANDRPVIKPAYVFNRGNQNDIGDPVNRCFPSALLSAPTCFQSGSGRLELAQAITSERNPVAARVLVNRIWQRLFGEGLVRTPSDFGIRGDLPTHPELLDRLAEDFLRDGLSMKRLIRRIVLSATYQQSSADRPAARLKDPENKLLWRMPRRRLDFEALRDSMLSVAGRLDDTLGGQPISLVTLPADPRRTIYSIIERERPLALLKTFDVADPEQHSPQRYQTTVPQQGLFLLNSPFIGEIAQALAARATSITDLYNRVLGRDPTSKDLELAAPLWRAQQPPAPPSPSSPWRYGTASFDPATGKVSRFLPFRYFTGRAWQNASAGIDPVTGAAKLTAAGGAPGDDLNAVAVRRWIAPAAGPLSIDAKLVLSVGPLAIRFHLSNGIRGWVVSDRKGVLGKWRVDPPPAPADGISYKANPSVDTNLNAIAVEAGEILDFVVDADGDYEADDFQWSPVLTQGASKWDARKEFAGPAIARLNPREQLAQVLLLTNEFAFLD